MSSSWGPILVLITGVLCGLFVAMRLFADRHEHVALSRFRISPQWVGALWGGGTVAVLSFVLFLMAQHPSKPQPEATASMPPPNTEQPTANTQEFSDPELKELHAALTANPNNVHALVRLAHRLLANMMIDEAKVLNDRALSIEPGHLEARVHQAVLKVAQNNREGGLADLNALLEKHPTMGEGWFFKGMLSMQAGDRETMRQSFETYLKVDPQGPMRTRVEAMLQSMASSPQSPSSVTSP